MPGLTLKLEGEANDYVGKGMSGGEIAIFPDRDGPVHHTRRRLPATPSSTEPPVARSSLPVLLASASPSATAARPPLSKAWAITAAST